MFSFVLAYANGWSGSLPHFLVLLFIRCNSLQAQALDGFDIYEFKVAVLMAVEQICLTEIEYSPCLFADGCVTAPEDLTADRLTSDSRFNNKNHLLDGITDGRTVCWNPALVTTGTTLFSLKVPKYSGSVTFKIYHFRQKYTPGYSILKNGVELIRETSNAGPSNDQFNAAVFEIAAKTVKLSDSCSIVSVKGETVVTVSVIESIVISPLDWSTCPGITDYHLLTGPTRIVFQGPDTSVVGTVPKGDMLFDLSANPGVISVEVSDMGLSYTSNPIPLMNAAGSSIEVILKGVEITVIPSETDVAEGIFQVSGGASIFFVDSSMAAADGMIRQPVVIADGAHQLMLVSSSFSNVSITPIQLIDTSILTIDDTMINGCEARTSQFCDSLPLFDLRITA